MRHAVASCLGMGGTQAGHSCSRCLPARHRAPDNRRGRHLVEGLDPAEAYLDAGYRVAVRAAPLENGDGERHLAARGDPDRLDDRVLERVEERWQLDSGQGPGCGCRAQTEVLVGEKISALAATISATV